MKLPAHDQGRAPNVMVLRSTAAVMEPRVLRTCRALIEIGCRVNLILWDRLSEANWLLDKVEVTLVRVPGEYGGGWRLLKALVRWNLALLRYLLAQNPDAIHACDLDTVVPALVARKLRGSKVVYDIFDWYADTHPVGTLRPLVASLERWIARQVDCVIIAHEARARQLGLEMAARKDGRQPHIVCIYNAPEIVDGRTVHAPGGLPSRYIAYCGLLAEERGIETLIEAAALANIDLVIAGWGPLEGLCRERSAQNPRVHWLGRLPHQEVLAVEANAVANVALYDPSVPNNRYAAPNKLFESMALGRPFVTNDGTLAADLVRLHGCGTVVPYADVLALAEAIDSLARHPTLCYQYGEAGRVAYLARYSAERMRERLQEVYRELLR
ncbi:MAG: glycosyltransferase family 4 protein [Moorellales bacterium]